MLLIFVFCTDLLVMVPLMVGFTSAAHHASCVVCCCSYGLWIVFLVPEWKLGVVRHYWLDLCVWFVERKRREVPRDYYSVLSHQPYSCNLI
jgi:hypothetical protein